MTGGGNTPAPVDTASEALNEKKNDFTVQAEYDR